MLLADDSAHFEAAFFRNHQVKDDQVRQERVRLGDGFFTVSSRFHDIVFELEVVLETEPDDFFVFDD